MSSEAGSLEIQFQDQEQAILLESVSDVTDRPNGATPDRLNGATWRV